MLTFMVTCEEGDKTLAIINDDGELFFPHYDAEADMIAVELGDESSECASILLAWDNDPLDVICASGFFPIDLTGRILSLWCKEAARKSRKALKKAKCFKETMACAKACEKFWKSSRRMDVDLAGDVEAVTTAGGRIPEPPESAMFIQEEEEVYYDEPEEGETPWERYIVIDYDEGGLLKNIHQTKSDLIRAWNNYVATVTWGSSAHSRIVNKAITAVLENVEFALKYVRQIETYGDVEDHIEECSPVTANVLDVFFLKAYPGSVDIAGDLMRIPEYMDEGREYMFELAMKEIRKYQ